MCMYSSIQLQNIRWCRHSDICSHLNQFKRKERITRMHSSRMRTGRFNGHLYGGEGGVQGVCVSSGVYTPSQLHAGIHTTCPIVCWDTHPSPVDRQTPVKNITFPQLLLRAVKILIFLSDEQRLLRRVTWFAVGSSVLLRTLTSVNSIWFLDYGSVIVTDRL